VNLLGGCPSRTDVDPSGGLWFGGLLIGKIASGYRLKNQVVSTHHFLNGFLNTPLNRRQGQELGDPRNL